MTKERFPDGLRPSTNILEVKSYLAMDKGNTLMAQIAGSDKLLMLVLNSSGQLCYREGNNIKLVPGDGRDLILLPESEQELRSAAGRMEEKTEIETSIDDAELRRMAAAINTIIEGTVRERQPRGSLMIRNDSEKRVIPVARTEFKLNQPPQGNTSVKGRAYYRAALDSIENYERLLANQNVIAKRIVTMGNIIPYGDTKKQFEMRLVSNGRLYFEELASGQTFVKYRVWRDYNVNDAANDEAADESMPDEDIPF